MAGLAVESDPHQPAAGHAQARRSLNVDEIGIDRIGKPGQLQAPTGKRATVDRGAVETRLNAGRRAPAKARLPVPAGRTIVVIDVDEFGWPAIERHGECGSANRAGGEFGLIIAGDESVGADLRRPEVILKEAARGSGRQRRRPGGPMRHGKQGIDIDGRMARLRWRLDKAVR